MNEIQKNTKYNIITFDGKNVGITEEQNQRLQDVLLKSGKFVLIDGSLVNISDIRGIYKSDFGDDIRIPDYLKDFERSRNATSVG